MVGLLLDSLSQNTGDQAIFEVMLGFLKKQQCTFDVLSPLGFDAQAVTSSGIEATGSTTCSAYRGVTS